ncbi:MAG: DUF3533 domain-containing protein [Actinobacteria bacterium]|nr:DUF3533 domain-containing protein [Actinomycetota bacterium]
MSRPDAPTPTASSASVLRRPVLWAAVAIAAVAALATALSYLGGFLNPDGNARDLPIALVDGDAGARFAGSRVDLGADVVAQIRAPNPALGRRVRWIVLPDRAAALSRIRADRAYAAIVVPPDFSARLVAIGTSAVAGRAERPARLEVLTSPAAGSFAGTYASTVARAAVDQVSRASSDRLAGLLAPTGARLTPAAAQVVGRPVEEAVTVAQPLPPKAGRGLAPFYFAVMLTLAGVIAANIVHAVVDLLAGHSEIEVWGRTVRGPDLGWTATRRWHAKLLVGAVTAVASGAAVTWAAVGLIGMGTTTSALAVGAFAVLGVAAVEAIALALLGALGLAGSLASVFVTTILGVPSAGGVYPLEATPAAFRFLAGWMPLRYLTDGARALIFFGQERPRLGAAVLTTSLWLAAATVAGTLVAHRLDRRDRLQRRHEVRLDRIAASPLPSDGGTPALAGATASR